MFLTSNMVPTGGASVATNSVVNAFSTTGVAVTTFQFSSVRGTKETLSGALTANTWKRLVNITGGAGSLSQCAALSADATSRTIGLRVVIDSVTSPYAFDSVSAATAATDTGIYAAGGTGADAANLFVDGMPIKWKTSCEIWVAASDSATDKIKLGYKYHTES